MNQLEGSRSLVRRGLDFARQGDEESSLGDLRAAVRVAYRDEGPPDQIASRLVLADQLGKDTEAGRVLDEAYSIAVDSRDTFGIASVAAQLGSVLVGSDPGEGATYLRRAASGFRAADQRAALLSVLVTMVGVLPDDDEAREALVELRSMTQFAGVEESVIGATGSLRWAERLLRNGDSSSALPELVDAHDAFVAARDGDGAIASGLRLNSALSTLHDAWVRFPAGEQLAERFQVPPAAMEVPVGRSEVMVGWNLDPRDLPITARHFAPFGARNGWVLWSGQEPFEAPGYLPVPAAEVNRWLPQVRPYLALPPGWAFQIAPDHEDVWEEPELLEDDQ